MVNAKRNIRKDDDVDADVGTRQSDLSLPDGSTHLRDSSEDLSSDVFSLIWTAPITCQAFMFALIVYACQQIWLWQLFFELLRIKNGVTRLGVPSSVELKVRICQGIALLVSVAIQSDLLTATKKLAGGYHIPRPKTEDDEESDRSRKLMDVSYIKWLISGMFQMFSGIMLTVVIFWLSMRAEDVLTLSTNFAALMFIAEIDNIGFALGLHGFISNSTQIRCEAISLWKIDKTKLSRNRENRVSRWMYIALVTALAVGYIFVAKKQLDGQHICNTLFIQLGDSLNPEVGAYSGLYFRRPKKVDGRFLYMDKDLSLQIAYCRRFKMWTMSYPEIKDAACDHYVARSEETSTFDVTSLSSSSWYVRDYFKFRTKSKALKKSDFDVGLARANASDLLISLDWLVITCNECNDETCQRGTCGNFIGNQPLGSTRSVSGQVCHCEDQVYGVNCEFARPCEALTLDQRTEPFVDASFQKLEGATFDLLPNASCYHRPVYYNATAKVVIFYFGRRWGLAPIQNFLDLGVSDSVTNEEMVDVLGDYFNHAFHGYWSNFSLSFVSEPMDAYTRVNDVSPERLKWYPARELYVGAGTIWADTTVETRTSLVCKYCNFANSNPCYYSAVCRPSNETDPRSKASCDCPPGTSGALCELEESCSINKGNCFHNGLCNPFEGRCDCPDPYFGKMCQFG